MRYLRLPGLLLVLLASTAAGQNPTKGTRFEIDEDLKRYPQKTPQEALTSVVKVLGENKLDYLLAQLADPAYVDERVGLYAKEYKGPPKAVQLVAFYQLVKEVREHFRQDPALVEELNRYAKEAIWDVKGTGATARLPDVASRKASFVQIKGRWYLQNPR